MSKFNKRDIIRFTGSHRMSGRLGFISKVEECDGDIRYTIDVLIPIPGFFSLFSMESDNEFELAEDKRLV